MSARQRFQPYFLIHMNRDAYERPSIYQHSKPTFNNDNTIDWDITTDIDRKTVDGYVRLINTGVPIDIIKLIFVFYHIFTKDRFQHINIKNYRLSHKGMVVKQIRDGHDSVCYGGGVISSIVGGIYQWTFKILQSAYTIAIGIDETRYIRKYEGGFGHHTGKSKYYALWHDGDKNRWESPEIIEAKSNSLVRFHTNDLVIMTLDLYKRTLSYKINKRRTQIVFKNVARAVDINYCMAIYMVNVKDSIQLVDSCKLKRN